MSPAGHVPTPVCKAARFYFLYFKNVQPMLRIHIHYGVNATCCFKLHKLRYENCYRGIRPKVLPLAK
jgi:hypothetical protein